MRAVNANTYFGVPSTIRFIGWRFAVPNRTLVIGCPRAVLFLRLKFWQSELYWFA